MIPTLIMEDQDMAEQIRDRVYSILKTEQAAQSDLATEKDNYDFDIFLERSNPWAKFLTAKERQTPILNVTLNNEDFDPGQSTIVGEFTKSFTTINIDCYGHGIGEDDPSEPGHVASDKQAALEARRAARFVRRVLMHSTYINLGYPNGIVHQRQVTGVQMLSPSMEGREVQQVCAARVVLAVQFNETTPFVEGAPLEIIGITVKRKETGETYFEYEEDFDENGS